MAASSITRSDAIYQRIRGDILAGRLSPGTRLPFADLCQRYEASTGVLREALPRLVEQGLVVSEPQIGFRVIAVSAEDLRHLTEARIAIETLVLRQSVEHGDLGWESSVLASHHRLSRLPILTAAGTINEEWLSAHAVFHRAILHACPNPRLRHIADLLHDSAEIYRCWSAESGQEHGRDVPAEHRRILEMVLDRDADAAVAALADHIECTTRMLLAGRSAGTD